MLAEIINADVCPHYFFEGVILGLIKPDISFCKDPEKVKEMKAFLKEHITKDQRQVAKAVNFGCPGCMGPARLYQHLRENGLNVTRKEAADLLNCWLSTFPEMKQHFNSRPPIKFDPYARYGYELEAGEEEGGLDDDPFKEKRKTRQLFKATTITGFIRNRATQNAACNCDFQNPVAHLAKEGMWNFECAGLGDRTISFCHDEINYWLFPQEIKTIVPLGEQLWLEPGKRVFPDVKLKCESSLSLYWDKEGVEFSKVQWDENGLPILDVPEFVKKLKGEKHV